MQHAHLRASSLEGCTWESLAASGQLDRRLNCALRSVEESKRVNLKCNVVNTLLTRQLRIKKIEKIKKNAKPVISVLKTMTPQMFARAVIGSRLLIDLIVFRNTKIIFCGCGVTLEQCALVYKSSYS